MEKISYLENELSLNPSKLNTLRITNYLISNPNKVNDLYKLFDHENNKIKWKAAWVFEHVFFEKSELTNPFISDLVLNFSKYKHNGVKRHISKILAYSEINELIDGNFINYCFDLICNTEIPVAIKSHVMQILFNITKKYPDIKPELKLVLEEQIPYNSVGFKSKAKKLIKLL